MVKKMPLLRVAGPTLLVSLLLFLACTASAVFLYRLHAQTTESLADDLDIWQFGDHGHKPFADDRRIVDNEHRFAIWVRHEGGKMMLLSDFDPRLEAVCCPWCFIGN